MSKVEHSYKPRRKQYWNNIISTLIGHTWTNTHVRKFWFLFTWTDLHYAKFAYMQTEICTWSQPICIWCKFCIRVQIHSHGHFCTGKYICKYANICTRMQNCPCECTFSLRCYMFSISSSINERMLVRHEKKLTHVAQGCPRCTYGE